MIIIGPTSYRLMRISAGMTVVVPYIHCNRGTPKRMRMVLSRPKSGLNSQIHRTLLAISGTIEGR